MPENNLKSAIEALLFVSERPLAIEEIRSILDDLDAGEIRRSIEELRLEYENSSRGLRISEIAGGFQMVTSANFAPFLKRLYKQRNTERLSKPALETLAIVAYKQPITRLEIEALRTVNSDGVIDTLRDKGLVRIVGRRKAPGRPKLYGTTRQFLEHFGLRSLEELPKIDSLEASLQKKEIKDGIEKITQAN